MNTLQQSETNLPVTCPFPKNIIQTLLISANLQFHPSFFNLSYPKNYCQKYYLYRMINHMVYTPHQLNYSNIQVPSQLLFFRRYSIYLSDLELIHQSSKLLKITPVSDDDTDANNNRPISLLSNFNRVLQKIIYSRLTSYIKKHELLYSSQYGFRKGHSTQHVILDIVHDIQTNMNQRLLSCGVFIDHKKAFHTVDHDILLDRLNHYGFREQRKQAIIYQIELSLDVVFLKDQFLDHCFFCYMSMMSTDAQINLGFTSLQTALTFCMWKKI